MNGHNEGASSSRIRGAQRARGALVLLMGCLAIAASFFAGPSALFLVGLLLVVCGVLELLEIFQASQESFLRSAYLSGALSIAAGLLLLAHPQAVLRGVAYLLAGLFFIDGLGKTVAAWRAKSAHGPWRRMLASGSVNILLALALVTRWPFSGSGVALILVGLRMLTAGWSMLMGWKVGSDSPSRIAAESSHPDRALGLPAHAEFARLDEAMAKEEAARRRIDASWCWTFVLIFFAIHVGRMNVTYNLVGMVSPFAAVLGDVATSLLIAFGLILPYRVFWRKMTRPVERRCWHGFLERLDQDREPGLGGLLYRRWLVGRFRFARRAARMKFSPRTAVGWGLFVGLPATAILIAINPIWGFSWFFNSESWATEVWDRWAAARTDIWREQMVRAVEELPQAKSLPSELLFQVTPEGVEGRIDFSFLVLGDTGEGGTAQQSLRDQYLKLGQRPDVRFLVISSDVIYPSGAMADYESKFYLPFKGFTKPIYAIPGNHDWYDALEGFAANFFEADAARACMRARVEADQRISTTTDSHIEALIREAGRLRLEFGVSTGWQRGPFFELQTDRFALIAVDTGVLRQVDTQQWRWLKEALERSRGKFIIANLGHPLFAGGRYQGGSDEEPKAGEWTSQDPMPTGVGFPTRYQVEPFAAIHRLLREHHVQVVMAGDTHYFESYREDYEADGAAFTMHHFVNGGGGAYLSIGTPLDWPAKPAVPNCAFYPRTDALIAKLDRETPIWKEPLWQWAKRLRGWPFSAETLAGAFNYNQAPFFQSFLEIRVENSKNRLLVIPHGVNGPLRWRDLQTFGQIVPAGKNEVNPVEFEYKLPKRQF